MTGGIDLTALLAVVVLVFTMGALFRLLARSLNDVFGLFVVTFGLFYGFRAVLIGTGLDVPTPDYLFAGNDISGLTVKAIAFLILFLVCFALGAVMTGLKTARTPGILFVSRDVSSGRMLAITLTLTAVSALISAALIARYGSFGGLLTAAKVEKDLAGSYYLKTPIFLGALVATATFLDLRRKKDKPTAVVLLVAGCAVFNSVMVFAWGQRSAVAIVVAMVLLGSIRQRESGERSRALRSTGRILVAALLVVGLAAGLRITRDTLVSGQVYDSYAQGNVWRKASLGVNATYFDASLLAYRDWPGVRPYRDGEDFSAGVLGTVPRALWAGKPVAPPGSWFRQVYEPEIVNGWPVGAPTIWYLNYGLLGLIIGGLVSGLSMGWVASRRWAAPDTGINTALTFVLTVFVFQLGYTSDTPARAVGWLLPLAVVLIWVKLPERARKPRATRPGAPRPTVPSSR